VFHSIKHEAYRLAVSLMYENDEQRYKELQQEAISMFEYASKAKTKRNCIEMIDFAKSRFIEANPNVKIDENINVLNLENGVYDFDQMKFVQHAREYYQTRICNVSFDENAQCDVWNNFLYTVLPDADVRKYLQKIAGYTLSAYYNEKLLLILCGGGDNGKTTFVNAIKHMLGSYATTVAPSTIVDSARNRQNGPRPDLLRLRDRRLFSVSEFEKAAPLSEALIKTMTGMGAISCRGLHKSVVEFDVTGVIWLDSNFRPEVSGTDYAIWSRLKVIPFDVRVPKYRQDKNLSEKLSKEMPGILNWCIEGYRLYQQEGLVEPSAVRLVVNEYKEDMTALRAWWIDCVDVVE